MRCAYLNIASGAPSSGTLGGSTGGAALLPATWGLPQDARQIGRLVYGSRMLLQQPPTSNENRWARLSAGAAPRVSLVVLEACRERFCKLPPLATGGGDSHRGWLAAGCCCCWRPLPRKPLQRFARTLGMRCDLWRRCTIF